MENKGGPSGAGTPGRLIKVRIYKRKPGEDFTRVVVYARYPAGVRLAWARHADVKQAFQTSLAKLV